MRGAPHAIAAVALAAVALAKRLRRPKKRKGKKRLRKPDSAPRRPPPKPLIWNPETERDTDWYTYGSNQRRRGMV
eukprot:1148764-Pelagomonas_calceolata.AAC.1